MLLLACMTQAHALTSPNATFGFVDLLVWQVRESGADNWGQSVTAGGSNRRLYKVLDAPFDWNTGVRIGVGHSFDQDAYDVTLAYTHYQATASNQASGTVISSFDGNYFVNNTNGANLDISYSNASVRYQFFYNTVDIILGRNCKLDSTLLFHPYLGLKAASINQNIYSNWSNPTIPTNFVNGTENLENNFSGIGPLVGIDSAWSLYTGASQSVDLIGNLAGGLLFGHWSFRDVYANDAPVNITVHNDSVNGASPLVAGLVGLQWSKQLGKSEFSIRLGYEAQIWFNQVAFYSLNLGKINRPVSLQGGNVEFRVNL
jgi:hypothetical protein